MARRKVPIGAFLLTPGGTPLPRNDSTRSRTLPSSARRAPTRFRHAWSNGMSVIILKRLPCVRCGRPAACATYWLMITRSSWSRCAGLWHCHLLRAGLRTNPDQANRPRAAAVVSVRPIRDNSAVAADYDGTDEFRGASFTGADFTAANFRDCDLRQAKITDSWLVDVRMSGLVENFVVNDVDITAFVEGELDKRHPERVQLRKMRTVGDYRAMWDTIERLWAGTVARAGRLPGPALHQRVDGEWSFVETLRHLVMATDRWAGYMILDKPMPYHPLGLPQPGFTRADAAALGIDLDARPSLAEVLEARGTRVALVRGIIDGLSDDDLERVCPRLPAPGYPEEARSVGLCLGVVMKEECEHRRYAVRDLAALEADSAGGPAHRS